jgi:hypothetical protein
MEKLFVDGMIIKKGRKDFIKCSLAFKCKDFTEFMKANHKEGWLNVDLKMSKSGKLYAEVDTWEPNKKDDSWGEPAPEDTTDFGSGVPQNDPEIPF